MPLHLIKLAVGCESVKELKGWVAERMATAKKKGLPLRHIHITRMTPKRDEELLAGGSLYWVIKGEIAAREKIIAIEPFRDKDGIGRCRLVMQPKVIAVSPRPMRRVPGLALSCRGRARRPISASAAASVAAMPEPMRRELRDLGTACSELAAIRPRYCRSGASCRSWRRPESAPGHPSSKRPAPASRRGGPRNNPARSRRPRSVRAPPAIAAAKSSPARRRLALSFMARYSVGAVCRSSGER